MYVGKHFAGKYFIDALKNIRQKVLIDEDGFGVFTVEGGSVSVYRPMYGQVIGKRDEELFVDKAEKSAYAEVIDGVEPEIMVESNYKHLDDGVDKILAGEDTSEETSSEETED